MLDNKRLFLVSIFCVVILFLCSRLIYIESDLPAWLISYYQPIDEFYYTIASFDLYHHGVFVYHPFEFIETMVPMFSYAQTLITYVSLEIFGNNYYGLRLGSTFSALAVFLLTLYILLESSLERNGENRAYLIGLSVALLFLLDFSFNLASRVAEPTIFRMFFMMAAMVVVYKFHKYPFFVGAFAFCSFIFVYSTNIFVPAAAGVSIVIFSLQGGHRKTFFNTTLYVVGCLVAFLFFLFFNDVFVGGSYFADLQALEKLFHGRVAVAHVNLLHTLIENGQHVFQTNMFMYNLPLLLLFLFSLPLFVYILYEQKNKLDILILTFLCCLFFQSVYINDYFQRKMIILYPLVVLVIGRVWIEKNAIFNLKDKYIFRLIYAIFLSFFTFICIDFHLTSADFLSGIIVYSINGLLISGLIFSLFTKRYRLPCVVLNTILLSQLAGLGCLVVEKYQNNINLNVVYILIAMILAPVVMRMVCFRSRMGLTLLFYVHMLVSVLLVFYFALGATKVNEVFLVIGYTGLALSSVVALLFIRNMIPVRVSVLLLFLLLSSSSVYMNYRYIYGAPTFIYKQVMVDIGKTVGDNFLGGTFAHGFRLYNEVSPLFNTYHYKYFAGKEKYMRDTEKLVKHYGLKYALGYEKDCKHHTDYILPSYGEKLCLNRLSP